MAITGTPVGPFPPGTDPDVYDRLRRRVLWMLPSGLYLLGSQAEGRRNLMTLNWATQLSFDPKLVGVSVERGALTHRLVIDGGAFALSLLRRGDRAVVRKFVRPVEQGPGDAELNGFEVRTASTGAPIFSQAAAWLDCRLREQVSCGDHTLFIGEVVDCGSATANATAGGPGMGATAGGPGMDATAGGPRMDATAGGPGMDATAGVLRMEDTRMNYGG